MSKWIGFAVSVSCGEPLGCYQGTILAADGTTITLTKAFRNGFPYPKSQVTLNAADIKELKIIESKTDRSEQPRSTVAVAKGKKAARTTVCETLQANPSSSDGVEGGPAGPAAARAGAGGGPRSKPVDIAPRSKPVDIAPARSNKATHTGSYGSTPKARAAGGTAAARRRNEAAFGDAIDLAIDQDFDFEGNLALFDKRALWEQMNNQKPDLVRQTDEVSKFRHDENILGGLGRAEQPRRAIRVPDAARAAGHYVTDEGVYVPAVTARLRRALWAGLARAGLADQARVLLARATADVCVRLVGGGRRLEPRNAHQAPAVVVLAARHSAGVTALVCARLLASHNARVVCYLAREAAEDGQAAEAAEDGAAAGWARERAALALSDVAVAERLEELPRPDLVLLALQDPLRGEPPDRYSAALAWARGSRAGVVSVEPAAGQGGAGGVAWRAGVAALLPPAGAPGRLYLADVAPPPRLFAELGVHYRPPFGAAPLLALHPADD